MSISISEQSKAAMYQPKRTLYEDTGNEQIDAFYRGLSSAVEKSTGKALGKPLSITTIPFNDKISYGMVASYSDATTANNPVIRVSSNWGGEQRWYDVHVNEVDPSNATQLEMFALMAYQDDQGITERGTFGSYQKMKAFAHYAELSGYTDGIYDYNSFLNEKKDWISIIKKMLNDYMSNPLTYGQGLDCQKLIFGMEKAEQSL